MASIIGQFLIVCCGSILTLITSILFTIAQNLPEILGLLKTIWDGITQLTYQVYRVLIDTIPEYLGFRGPTGIFLILATTIISVGLFLGVSLLINLQITMWTIGAGVAHGIYIGIFWDRLADPDGLYIGRRLE